MNATTADKSSDGPTVYFDGSCPLCSVEIGFYRSRDSAGRLDFIDVSKPDVEPGPSLSCDEAMRRFHVRNSDGTLLSGAAAFVAIWDEIPGWKRAARVARVPGVMPVLELAYRVFLPIRPALSRIARGFGARPINPEHTDT
ncbi:DUF393 domain-containing protein [Sulfitobacter sp. D35]|uniref:thiol-disulfide oxidoreductase DCC family protein n=1 Tax=Sulfitobacter sp. D35 TaxID=3083252 RepID=UPI00296FFA8D|nr:DUF393 domain-containing protein [Sulfitobacter sp. D35]MDW4496666.1 DUF393 domain-containing protein [Sulfitobacter sp. D35]